MPDPAAPAGAAPAVEKPQTPPTGSTPATAPTPNQGFLAAAYQTAGVALKLLEVSAQKAGASSELGQELYKFIPRLAKLLPPGTNTPAGEKNEIEGMALRNAQQGQQVQQMRQSMAAPPGGGGPQAAAA